MRKTLPFIGLMVLITACERETKVDTPAHRSRLVIYALQSQDRIFNVRIGRSLGATEPVSIDGDPRTRFDVPNAVVLLKQNSAVLDTLVYNDTTSHYEGRRHKAVLGNTYTIEASAPDFDKAEGTSFFPSLVRPVSVTLRRNARISEDGNEQDEITVRFTDDGTKTNYYLLRIQHAGGYPVYCVNTNDKDVERLVYSDPFYTEECLNGDRLLVADKNFNGAVKTFVFYVNHYDMNVYDDQQGQIRKPTLELLHINEEYFRYMKSVNAYDNAVENPFAEPVNVITNIKNGYGFFTTFAQAVDTLQ